MNTKPEFPGADGMYVDPDDISYMNPTPSNSWLGWWLLFLLGLVVLMLTVSYFTSQQDNAWAAFKTEHRCRPIGAASSSSFNTIGIDSRGTSPGGIATSSNRVEWLCSDGHIYTR